MCAGSGLGIVYRFDRTLTIDARLASLGRQEGIPMANIEDDRTQPQPLHVLGQDLAKLSVDELERRIDVLQGEIARIEDDLKGKKASRAAADSIFKT